MTEPDKNHAEQLTRQIIQQLSEGRVELLKEIADERLVFITDDGSSLKSSKKEVLARLDKHPIPLTIDSCTVLAEDESICSMYAECHDEKNGKVQVIVLYEKGMRGLRLLELQIISPMVHVYGTVSEQEAKREIETVECDRKRRNYVRITYSDGSVEIRRGTLKNMLAESDTPLFRVNRCILVNPAEIRCLRSEQLETYRHRNIRFDPRLHADLERAMKF